MPDNEEGKDTSRGNEWEVVSLSASAYDAAPGPKDVELNDDEKSNMVLGGEEGQTSNAMFMSGHFVVPPSQHENLPMKAENTEISVESLPQMVTEEGTRSNEEQEEKKGIDKGLTESNEFPGIHLFDEKGNMLSIGGSQFEEHPALEGLSFVEKEQSIYSAATFSSFHSEAAVNEEESVVADAIESLDSGLVPEILDTGENKCDGSDLPCDAWWKRRAASLYAHAKEANAFWSIFIAAAVMGIVIIGQRWQVLQHKWQFSINDERMVGRMVGPISRFKDVILGGNRRGSMIGGKTSTEH